MEKKIVTFHLKGKEYLIDVSKYPDELVSLIDLDAKHYVLDLLDPNEAISPIELSGTFDWNLIKH